jgi:hypothetical protein
MNIKGLTDTFNGIIILILLTTVQQIIVTGIEKINPNHCIREEQTGEIVCNW